MTAVFSGGTAAMESFSPSHPNQDTNKPAASTSIMEDHLHENRRSYRTHKHWQHPHTHVHKVVHILSAECRHPKQLYKELLHEPRKKTSLDLQREVHTCNSNSAARHKVICRKYGAWCTSSALHTHTHTVCRQVGLSGTNQCISYA